MPYDDQNIFAKILRGEIPCEDIYRDEYALAFRDISPQAPIHILVIPTGPYVDIVDFAQNASKAEIIGFYKAVAHTATKAGLTNDGFRTIANTGTHGGQEVPHFHIHLLGGKQIGKMVAPF